MKICADLDGGEAYLLATALRIAVRRTEQEIACSNSSETRKYHRRLRLEMLRSIQRKLGL